MQPTNAQPLPPKGGQAAYDHERQFKTALKASDYLLLETESLERGMKPYSLAKSILTLYLAKKLVLLQDLPESVQIQIAEHFQNKAPEVYKPG